ncbi:ribosomal protein L22 [Xylariomycetidae sp. FL0641]|nr:ribosomal protein L22 [Xylariomycetidae sp. FL0641]
MSFPLPVRRAAQCARATVGKPSSHRPSLLSHTQRRNASWLKGLFGKDTPIDKEISRIESEADVARRLVQRTRGENIFDDEIRSKDERKRLSDMKEKGQSDLSGTSYAPTTIKEHLARVHDPDPRWRVRFLKRAVWDMVRAGPLPTKKQWEKENEHMYTARSNKLPTSVKKLNPLARQIAGLTVEDAITQMHYSKKKMSNMIAFQLEMARDRAIVARGMGLGVPNGEVFTKPKKIKTKDGRWIEITDPSRMYVDEAWVTKGGQHIDRIEYMGRGRASKRFSRKSRLYLRIKEERTRIRTYNERKEKEYKLGPWVHLPNRPITAQRQYYCW